MLRDTAFLRPDAAFPLSLRLFFPPSLRPFFHQLFLRWEYGGAVSGRVRTVHRLFVRKSSVY